MATSIYHSPSPHDSEYFVSHIAIKPVFASFKKTKSHLILCMLETPERVLLASSEDPDEMPHDAAFHQGLHCLLRLKQSSGAEIHHDLENATCDPLKYTMGSPILIVSICMGKSIRIQRVNSHMIHSWSCNM